MEKEKVDETKKDLKRKSANFSYPILKHQTDSEKDIHINAINFTIGRALDSDCVFSEICISRTHCTFSFNANTSEWYLTNSSSSGTFHNDVQLSVGHQTLVVDGDEIRLTSSKTDNDHMYTFTCVCDSSSNSMKPVNEEIKTSMKELAIENHPIKRPKLECNTEPGANDAVNDLLQENAELKRTIQQNNERMNELEKFRECVETNMSCAICNEVFIKPTMLNCCHTFCLACITRWKEIKKQCPMCRANFTSENQFVMLDNIIQSFYATAAHDVKRKRQEAVAERSCADVAPKRVPAGRGPSTSRGGGVRRRRGSNRRSPRLARTRARLRSATASNALLPDEVIVLDDSMQLARARHQLPTETIEILSEEEGEAREVHWNALHRALYFQDVAGFVRMFNDSSDSG